MLQTKTKQPGLARYLPLLLLACSPAVFAEDRIPPEINYTGTLVTSNPNTVRQGALILTPNLIYIYANERYDASGQSRKLPHSSSQWQVLLPIAYGIAPRLTGKLNLGAARTSENGKHTTAMRATDASVRLQYLLQAPSQDGTRPAVSVFVQHNLLTAPYDSLRDHAFDAMGSGARRTTLSLLAQRTFWMPNERPLRIRGQLSWSPRPPAVRLRDVSVYSTPRGFRGRYHPGAQLSLSVGAEYSLDPRWVLALDVSASRQGRARLDGDVHGKEGKRWAMRRTDNYGAVYSVTPGIEYNFNSQYGLIVGAQVSVAGHNTRSFVSPRAAFNMAY
ncbi:hypothetical protein [Dyella sp. 2RAB6]|uniref:hypothetical protein n=1 Tax=Dyella sp. 2RAB6 TaxID=3232992 RepID=UPI003F8DA85C